MKRLLLLVSILVPAAALWPAGSTQATQVAGQTITQRFALQPVVNPAACRAAVVALPTFTSLEAMQAFTTTGPCAIAPAASANAALALPHTINCAANLSHIEETLGLLNDWVTDTWSLSCTGGVGTPTIFCENLTVIADAAPPVEPGIPAIGSGCDSRSPIQETPAALHVPAVQAGLVVGFDSAGDVGAHPVEGTFPT